jgi:predicted short-subunit dehydrogenase-like oxidoreductase (DUF2520 family)
MFIALIGTGNVATILGKLFFQNGHVITSVSGRNAEAAKLLAQELGAKSLPINAKVALESEITIIALADEAISSLPTNIFGDSIVVHTAGAVPMDVLKNLAQSYGVVYPLQSLRKETVMIPKIPFLIEGSDAHTQRILEQLVTSCKLPSQLTNSEQRAKMHAAAVMVSNFTNYLYAVAEDFCKKEAIEFKVLLPLIEETASRLTNASPAALQTGPAVRGDVATMEKHQQLLQSVAGASELYVYLSEKVKQRFG